MLFVAVGVGATTAVVVGWQFGRVASDSAESGTLEGSKSATTGPARALGGTAIESSGEAVSNIGSGSRSAVEVVREGAGGAVDGVGEGARSAVEDVAAEVAQSAGQAAQQEAKPVEPSSTVAWARLGEGAGQATKRAGEATRATGQAARAVGGSTGQAAQGVGEAGGRAGDATEQTTRVAQEDPGQTVEGTAARGAAPGGPVLSATTDEAGRTVRRVVDEAGSPAEQTFSESGEVSEVVVVVEASTTGGAAEQKGEVQVTSAAVRRAKDLGVDLSQVEATASGGCTTIETEADQGRAGHVQAC